MTGSSPVDRTSCLVRPEGVTSPWTHGDVEEGIASLARHHMPAMLVLLVFAAVVSLVFPKLAQLVAATLCLGFVVPVMTIGVGALGYFAVNIVTGFRFATPQCFLWCSALVGLPVAAGVSWAVMK